ncbi:MAG: 5-histidylcysteine sulfoxide synthase [Alphaproteobacteria bacterium]|nr:5-histidylcysteine sulfoxide synthase [Alphaproteobacteria bacterium]
MEHVAPSSAGNTSAGRSLTVPPDSLLPPGLVGLTNADLIRYFDNTWELYEWLFDALQGDALYAQPDPLRHPLVFYWGHTAAFYINKLVMAGFLPKGPNPRFEELFAKGVDPACAGDLDCVNLWPSRDDVRAYRAEAHAIIRGVMERAELEPRIDDRSPHWSILMGLEHDRIHFETSSVLFRQLAASRLKRPPRWSIAPTGTPAPARRWLDVPARRVSLGRGMDLPQFGWDNEFGHLDVDVAPFQATAHLVTNQDFLAFWAEGGYHDPRLWTADGWAWRQELGVTHPRFWIPTGSDVRYRAMFDELDMPWSWPAEVNGFEAQAFCNWVGGGVRLMTEAEWAAICQDAPLVDNDSIGHPGYNLNLRYGSPTPVDLMAAGRTPLGFYDVYGNVWQWFSDDFRPLPGFRTHRLYEDFSEPYFDSEHAALGGGAWASMGTSGSRFYRLWFRRHFYQHAGLRLARSL